MKSIVIMQRSHTIGSIKFHDISMTFPWPISMIMQLQVDSNTPSEIYGNAR